MSTNKTPIFKLSTQNTTYAFCVTETGHLEHLYYGKKIKIDEDSVQAMKEKHAFAPGCAIYYDDKQKHVALEDMCLEMSSYGKGDIREPFLEVVHEDGSITSDFLYEKAEVTTGKEAFETLPGSYDEENM